MKQPRRERDRGAVAVLARRALKQAPPEISPPNDGQGHQGSDDHQHHGSAVAHQSAP
jgi:hypothetical protein